jgi:hypothetical protein
MAPDNFLCPPSLAATLRAAAARRQKWLLTIFCVRHPWRPPCGPSLRDVKNGSWQFFVSAIPATTLRAVARRRLTLFQAISGLQKNKNPHKAGFWSAVR